MDIWYTALFVKEPNNLVQLFPPKHEKVFAHHSTIVFEPQSLNGIEIGKLWNIKILGRATDENGDTLLVENLKSKNKYPHITLSCKKGVDPFYSNELLERAVKDGTIEYFKEPFFVETIEGYGDHEGKVIINLNIS